jgi:DNA-binding CsgD family transcriptional regulator
MSHGKHRPARAGPSLRRLRPVTKPDAIEAAAWAIRNLPVPPELASALPGLLERLVREETLRGMCVEEIGGEGAGTRLLGIGLSGFLSDACVASFLEEPFPHLEVALLERARVPGSGPGFLSIDAIAEANAGDGLTLCPLFWLHHRSDLPESESNALLALGQQSFLQVHRGYRLKGLLKEADARMAPAYLSGGFREARRLPAGMPLCFAVGTSHGERVVFMTTAEDMQRALPGAAIGPLFATSPPRCAFSRKQQRVLEAAVSNMTDRDIAAALGVKPNAVAQHWRKIYQRVEREIPFLFDDQSAGTGTRGAEKRRRVVAYMAEHPEELRPYAEPRRAGRGPG